MKTLAFVALSLALAAPAAAQQLAIEVGGPANLNSANGTDAFVLTPTQDLTVTSLCYFAKNGMSQSHPVALYEVGTQAQLAYTVVTASSPVSRTTPRVSRSRPSSCSADTSTT